MLTTYFYYKSCKHLISWYCIVSIVFFLVFNIFKYISIVFLSKRSSGPCLTYKKRTLWLSWKFDRVQGLSQFHWHTAGDFVSFTDILVSFLTTYVCPVQHGIAQRYIRYILSFRCVTITLEFTATGYSWKQWSQRYANVFIFPPRPEDRQSEGRGPQCSGGKDQEVVRERWGRWQRHSRERLCELALVLIFKSGIYII